MLMSDGNVHIVKKNYGSEDETIIEYCNHPMKTYGNRYRGDWEKAKFGKCLLANRQRSIYGLVDVENGNLVNDQKGRCADVRVVAYEQWPGRGGR